MGRSLGLSKPTALVPDATPREWPAVALGAVAGTGTPGPARCAPRARSEAWHFDLRNDVGRQADAWYPGRRKKTDFHQVRAP